MTTVHMDPPAAKRTTWRELAVLLGEQMRSHAHCPDHARREADPDNCPFCADRAAFDAYAAKVAS